MFRNVSPGLRLGRFSSAEDDHKKKLPGLRCVLLPSVFGPLSVFPISPSMATRPAYLALLYVVRLNNVRTDQYKHCSSSASNTLLGTHIILSKNFTLGVSG